MSWTSTTATGQGLGPPGLGWLLRPGFGLLIVALPLSLVGLLRRATAGDLSARAVVVPALLFPLLFALTITLKLVNYTLIELPIFAVAIGWGLACLWQGLAWSKPLLAAVGAAVLVEGGLALARLEHSAATVTPYTTFIGEVRQRVPPGARILGLHSYWIGFQDHDYRSILVPLNFADLGVPLDVALGDVDPDVVLLDSRMRAYFDSPSAATDGALFRAWLTRHQGQLVGRVDDPTFVQLEQLRNARGQADVMPNRSPPTLSPPLPGLQAGDAAELELAGHQHYNQLKLLLDGHQTRRWSTPA